MSGSNVEDLLLVLTVHCAFLEKDDELFVIVIGFEVATFDSLLVETTKKEIKQLVFCSFSDLCATFVMRLKSDGKQLKLRNGSE